MTGRSSHDQPGDVRFENAPAPNGPTLTFIGHVRSAHADTATAPKNPARARERGEAATLVIDTPFRPGLFGLAGFSHLIVLGWLHQSRRDLIQIKRPGNVDSTGVFALRSPVRPNPISVAVARILSIDAETGVVAIDAIDLLDGTPIVDLKPYRPGVDAVPEAVVP